MSRQFGVRFTREQVTKLRRAAVNGESVPDTVRRLVGYTLERAQ
jgi:hypothetical protein